ncbi:MAG: hypothetical protein WC956_02635 [bacterium]
MTVLVLSPLPHTTVMLPLADPDTGSSISITAGDFPADSIPAAASICFAEGPEGIDSRVGSDERRSITAHVHIARESPQASFSRGMLKATHGALTRAAEEGVDSGVIDVDSALTLESIPSIGHYLALISILGGVRMFVENAFRQGSSPLLRHIVLAMGNSAYATFLSDLGGKSYLESFLQKAPKPLRRQPSIATIADSPAPPDLPERESAPPNISPDSVSTPVGAQPLTIDLTQNILPDGIDVNKPQDLTIRIAYQHRRGFEVVRETTEDVFLVWSPGFFEKLVQWKMTFSLFKHESDYFLYLTRWQHPEKVSPHDIVYRAREQLIKRFGEVTRGDMLQKGYVRVEKVGDTFRYTLFDIGGSLFHSRPSSEAGSTLAPVLKTSTLEMLAFFRAQFGIEVDVEGVKPPPPAPPEKGYGPR